MPHVSTLKKQTRELKVNKWFCPSPPGNGFASQLNSLTSSCVGDQQVNKL